MKKTAVVLGVCLLCSAGLLSGCFKPTETHAWGGSSLVTRHSGSSGSSSSSSSTSPASSTSSESSATPETTESTPVIPVEPAEPPKEANSARYNELRAEYRADPEKVKTLEKKLSENALFAGDSVCKGFGTFGIVNAGCVFADGTVGARNLLDREILWYGKRCRFADALEKAAPKRVYLSMGMNDVNMTTAEEYAENYRKIIDFTLSATKADVVVFAITPVNSDFTANSRIDKFNSSLYEMISKNYRTRVRFVDFAYMLKNSEGRLSAGLDSGDGIHLTPEVYHAAMIEVGEKLGLPL